MNRHHLSIRLRHYDVNSCGAENKLPGNNNRLQLQKQTVKYVFSFATL